MKALDKIFKIFQEQVVIVKKETSNKKPCKIRKCVSRHKKEFIKEDRK